MKLHSLRILLLIWSTLIIGLNLSAPKGPQQPQPPQGWIKPNIELMQTNPSIERYIRDSILPHPPLRPVYIHIHFQPLHPRYLGQTIQLGTNRYLIALNPIYTHPRLERTLHHELVHVKQHLRKDIEGNLWKGQPMDWSRPWSQRPWEVQAERETQLLFKPTHEAL